MQTESSLLSITTLLLLPLNYCDTSMGDMIKLLQFPSPFLKTPLSFPIPLQLSSHHAFFPLYRQLSLSSLIPHLSSPSNSPKDFLLISTSQQSDGSLVFKFGDASEIPPAEIDDHLAINDHQPHSNELQNEMPDCNEIAEKTVVDSVKDQQNPHNKLDNTNQSDSDVRRLDSEAVLEDEDIEEEESLKNEMIELDIDDEAVQVMELPPIQLQAQPILDEEEVSLKNEMIELDVQLIELPPLQSQAEPILDEEVSYVGLPSISGQDDSPSGDITDAAFPSLEESVVISGTNVNREEISLQSEDISALSLPISSASYPLEFNDAAPSAILQSDEDPEINDISEPAGPVPELSGTASEEARLNSVRSSTVAVSVPSAMASLPEATKVNDAITPSIQLSDADLHSEISVAADPGSGISAAAKINLRVKNSAPSLCVVSAAASIAHSAEALAGGDDAYFVCDNWFGVADGVGQWSFGGIDKGLYAQELIQNCERLARTSLSTGLNSLKELLQQSAARTESSGAARILVAHIVDQVLHVANIGDSGFIVVRNGTVFKKSFPMFHEFNFPYAVSFGENPVEAIEEYHVELEDGDIIVTATDGLFDNLYEREIASLVFKAVEDGQNVKDIAELLASRSQEVGRSPHVRTPFADAAQAAGHAEFRGGKFDHVTVIVSTVQKVCEF